MLCQAFERVNIKAPKSSVTIQSKTGDQSDIKAALPANDTSEDAIGEMTDNWAVILISIGFCISPQKPLYATGAIPSGGEC